MMFTQKNLMTVCCAAVLAFGLAACGSSSDDVKVMDTVIDKKPTTQVVPGDTPPTVDEIAAATMAAATKETEIGVEARETGDADAGIGGSVETDVDSTYSMTIERDRDGTTVKIEDSAMTDDDDPKFMQAMDLGESNGFSSTMHRRDNGMGEEEVVIVSTDIGGPTATPFDDEHTLNNNENDAEPAVFQSLTVDADNLAMWKADAFPSTPTTTRDFPQDDEATMDMNEGAVMGYFNGAPGTFECRSTECSLETDADGKLETVGGTWWFTPDEGAMVDVDDADYMRYGFWLKRTTDADGAITYDEVETFAFSSVDPSGSGVDEVEGTAKYNGGATGVYVKNVYNTDRTIASATSGFFTAAVELMAYFGGNDVPVSKQDSVTGTIDQFVLQHGEENAWSVALKGGISDTGTIEDGTANGGGDPGTLSGTFRGSVAEFDHDMDEATDAIARQPSSVVGEFNANFGDGSAAGGFGARK